MLFKTGCVKTSRPPLKRGLERLPRFWTASPTLTGIYWKGGRESRRGWNPTPPQRKCEFYGETGLRLWENDCVLEERTAKKEKGSLSPSYTKATSSHTPNEVGKWQLVRKKKKKRRKKCIKKKTRKDRCAAGTRKKGDGKTLHAHQVGRRHQGVGKGRSVLRLQLEGDEREGWPLEIKSWDPVCSVDQKRGSPSGSRKGGWRFSLPIGARPGGRGDGKRLRIGLEEPPEIRNLKETVEKEEVVAALCLALGRPAFDGLCRLFTRFGGVKTAVIQLARENEDWMGRVPHPRTCRSYPVFSVPRVNNTNGPKTLLGIRMNHGGLGSLFVALVWASVIFWSPTWGSFGWRWRVCVCTTATSLAAPFRGLRDPDTPPWEKPQRG